MNNAVIPVENISLVGSPLIIRRRGQRRLYNWDRLKVGQSIFVPFDEGAADQIALIKRLRNSVSWAKRNGCLDPDCSMAFAPSTKNGVEGVRAGRIA